MASSDPLALVILAAGKGKRMASQLPKVALSTVHKPLIAHVLESVCALNPDRLVLITGFGAEIVEKVARDHAPASFREKLTFARQAELLGTGDAVRAAQESLKGFLGTVLVVCGDVPLIRTETLRALIERHEQERATVSLISLMAHIPNSYGRIVRAADGSLAKIVEARDCSPAEDTIHEFNAGIYAIDSAFLFPALEKVTAENAQREYYLTDIVGIAVKEGQRVASITVFDHAEIQGVNSPAELAMVNETLRARAVQRLIDDGVIVLDRSSLWIDAGVRVAPGARIGPQVQLLGSTTVSGGAHIEGCAWIKDSMILENAVIKFGVRVENAVVGAEASVGPFAHLRPETKLGPRVKIGNFVETKKTSMGAGAKASHLSYVGDATVGEDVNIGAGVITCNYDGYQKYETVIERGSFIGSNSLLVAPVTVGEGAFVGAGSVITRSVGSDSLALARAEQVEKPGWAKRKREAMAKREKHKE